MTAVRFLLVAALPLSLSACDDAQVKEATTALGQIRDAPPAQRKQIIQEKIAKACATPMTNVERERFAALVLRLADDTDVVEAVGRLDQFDAETLTCRRGRSSKRKASS